MFSRDELLSFDKLRDDYSILLKNAFQVVHATPGGVASKKTASLQ